MKMFDADKTRMTGLPYGKKNYHNMLSLFHLIPERHGQTDGRTDIIAISISRVSLAIWLKYTHRTAVHCYDSNRNDSRMLRMKCTGVEDVVAATACAACPGRSDETATVTDDSPRS